MASHVTNEVGRRHTQSHVKIQVDLCMRYSVAEDIVWVYHLSFLDSAAGISSHVDMTSLLMTQLSYDSCVISSAISPRAADRR